METIIKKAIEGGWKRHYNMPTHPDVFLSDIGNYEYQIVLDHLFWQALGKACGWGKCCIEGHIPYPAGEDGTDVDWGGCDNCVINGIFTPEWQTNALRFHEINLTEGWNQAVEYLQKITK